ncbi:tyrosine-type recombinase/integrase [Caenimonas aquaedulcis]|uniref:Integrase arm-type DNA-binding domain-containing protein n=1 Tax=Caenimonas aquaedulcis TaxID=2793270 RepID=A0A931H4K2_9BURK|nr:site-specific integrase [Caenimonas aquaedulcis]MBG9388387.1 integrase arm-type DNA-binding domain-containing protein [Caenimonas aquaedulcis]
MGGNYQTIPAAAAVTRHNLLNDAAVRSKGKAPGYHLDGHGLYLQVGETGTRSWVLRYTLNNSRREMGLGSASDFGLAEARERAREARKLVAEGVDPIAARRQAKDERAAGIARQKLEGKTFKQCALEYIEEYSADWKNAKHGAQWLNTLTTYVFPKLGAKRMSDIDKADILRAISPIWKDKAETASRTLQRIRIVFNYAAAKDHVQAPDAEFWTQVKIALGGNVRARKVKHFASCPHSQVGRVLQRVWESTATDRVKIAFEFAVLNATRSGEVRGARWSEFDKSYKDWTIPGERMKSGRPHRIPLSKRAQKLMKLAEKLRTTTDGDLVFANPSGKPYSDMVFTQLLKRLKEPFTMHGFRSSFRVWGSEETQYAHELMEFALAHVVTDQTVRAYARSDMLEKRREMMDSWANYIWQHAPTATATES